MDACTLYDATGVQVQFLTGILICFRPRATLSLYSTVKGIWHDTENDDSLNRTCRAR